jgi:hypothetical protein
MPKILREKYKTYEGARKRMEFENVMAPGEYVRGDKAHRYRYDLFPDPTEPGIWRVKRTKLAGLPS